MKKIGKGDFVDWLWPVLTGLAVTVVALLLSDHGSDPERLDSFEKMFMPLVFTYATTMLGLSLACYTLFQTLDNDMVRLIRKWVVYTRFKFYIWHIMILLSVLAVLSLLELFVFDRLLKWVSSWILLGVPLFLSVLTLAALVYWIRLLIRFFDAEKERKSG
ncbi:MAG: hypothetical protein II903_09290 [Spirochaetales bacterium]|nr:hypothetical protein [Spirochaetales bacterium]